MLPSDRSSPPTAASILLVEIRTSILKRIILFGGGHSRTYCLRRVGILREGGIHHCSWRGSFGILHLIIHALRLSIAKIFFTGFHPYSYRLPECLTSTPSPLPPFSASSSAIKIALRSRNRLAAALFLRIRSSSGIDSLSAHIRPSARMRSSTALGSLRLRVLILPTRRSGFGPVLEWREWRSIGEHLGVCGR